MNTLLENAVVSIQLGLEDFASKDERRMISAVRNLYAGVLLLCKEVLRRLSPPDSNDLLIRAKKRAIKDDNGKVRLIGVGRKTIDRLEIEETFKQLQLGANLSNLKRLAEIRNDIEHSHPTHAPALIQEAIADAMPIIRDIIVKELNEEPSALLAQEAWEILLNEARVFKEEQDACKASFIAINWGSEILKEAFKVFRCPYCSSTLIRNDNTVATAPRQLELVCSKCGEYSDVDIVIEAALKESLRLEDRKGLDENWLLDECPECSRETYVFAEDKCLNPSCGFSLDGYDCALCGERLTLDDYRYGSETLCSYHAYVLAKDD